MGKKSALLNEYNYTCTANPCKSMVRAGAKTGGALCRGSANPLGFSPALLRGGAGLRTDRSTSQPHIHPVYIYSRCKYREATSAGRRTRLSSNSSSNLD